VGLEHVSEYWDNWLNFETFISDISLVGGRKSQYINRTLQLLRWQSILFDEPEHLMLFPPPSLEVQQVVFAAQEFANSRAGLNQPPTSCDLLFCACLLNSELSTTLQGSGLQLEKLTIAVKGPG
jgi:hypothetical protein